MAGQGDAFLRSVLGGDSAGSGPDGPGGSGTENVIGGGGAPGAGPGAAAEVQRATEDARRAVSEGHTPWSVAEGAGSVLLDASSTMTQGGGYRFDAEAIAAKITEAEALRDRIRGNIDSLNSAARAATPPSNDPPAVQQAERTRHSQLSAASHAESMFAYMQALIDSLRKANGTYQDREDETVAALRGGQGASGDSGRTGGLFE